MSSQHGFPQISPASLARYSCIIESRYVVLIHHVRSGQTGKDLIVRSFSKTALSQNLVDRPAFADHKRSVESISNLGIW